MSLTAKLLLVLALVATSACQGGNQIIYPSFPDTSCARCSPKLH